MKSGLYILRIDGGRKAGEAGEATPGAFAYILRDPNDRHVEGGVGSGDLKEIKDSHSAEYEALLAGLGFALSQGVKYIAVFSDSRTVVNQVVGQLDKPWKSSGHLADYQLRAREALKQFEGWQLSWVPREWNKEADVLVDNELGDPDAVVVHAED